VQRVRLSASGATGIEYDDEPVTFGVPFSEGDLSTDDERRVVTADGKPIPVQTEVLATWTPDGDDVKWLLVDAQLSVDAGTEPDLFLEYGDGVAATPSLEQEVTVTQADRHIEIDTGPMTLGIRSRFDHWRKPHTPELFKYCYVTDDAGRERDLFAGRVGPHLYATDTRGNRYDSRSSGPAPKVTIEESGPIRTCIRVDGHHVMKEGPKFCPYTLRLHVFAGSTDIRIQHTFTFDQEPSDTELSSIGIRLPIQAGDGLRAAIAGSDTVHHASNFNELYFHQRDHTNHEVTRDGESYGTGGRTDGWASLSGDRGGMAAVIANSWQEYPTGFSIDDRGIDVEIWPEAHDDPLTFTTPFDEPGIGFENDDIGDEEAVKRKLEANPTAPVSLKSFGAETLEDIEWIEAVMDRHAPDRPATYNDLSVGNTPTDSHNGVGAAKTTDVYLRLDADGVSDESAASLAASVQEPLVVRPQPEYMCETGAFPHVHPAGDERFAAVDAGIEEIFEQIAVEPVEHGDLYGTFRYGDMVCAHSTSAGHVYRYYRDETDTPEKAFDYLGPYHNEVMDHITSTWHRFARTGDREAFLTARRFAETNADVAFIHAHPTDPGLVGLSRRHNAHAWTGSPPQSHTVVRGLVLDYYLTGNRRPLEVAREAADRVVEMQEPAGIVSNRHRVLARNFTTPLSVLLDVYQATWEEKYGRLAERSLNWLLRTVPEPGMYPNTINTRGERGDEAHVQPPCYPTHRWGNLYYVYEMANRLFPSEALEEQILAEADWFTWEGPLDTEERDFLGVLHYQAATTAIAYELTTDLRYAAYADHLLTEVFPDMVESYREGAIFDFGHLWVNFTIPHLEWVVAAAEADDPKGLAAAKEEWRDTRPGPPEEFLSWSRPDDASRSSLGRLRTDRVETFPHIQSDTQ